VVQAIVSGMWVIFRKMWDIIELPELPAVILRK
jgi:hypothetical protein